MTPRLILTRADADSIRKEIESVYDGWFADSYRIDWEDFLDRLDSFPHIDMGSNLESPAIRRIKAIVAELRGQST